MLNRNRFSILAGIISVLAACSSAPPIETGPAKRIHVEEITIAQIHLGLSGGHFTCEELVDTYLRRIRRFDKTTHLNALTTINSAAITKAKRLDAEWKRDKKLRELHCVPVIVKDNFDTADMPTTAGSKVLAKNLPPNDAYVIRRLREAGAIVIAKSNMAEWAFSPYFTVSSTGGVTRNPYDLSRVPAGSSGGTASAVAANLGAVGMGTDTGNSIRGPASHTGLFGIRATIGVVSRDGIIPLLKNRDVAGPLTRSVEDSARIFNVIAGFDPADPLTRQSMRRLPTDYTAFLRPNGLRGARIGVLRALSNDPKANLQIRTLFEHALNDLRRGGAIIVDPFMIGNLPIHRQNNGFCSAFRWDVNEYFASLGSQAPVHDFMEIILAKKYHPSAQWGIDWAKSATQPPALQQPPCLGVHKDPRRANFLRDVLAAMKKYRIDAFVYPTWNNPPRTHEDTTSPHGNNSPVIAPHTGQPAITVPMGFTRENLPVGLQMVAKPFEEHKLFQYAYAYEQLTKHRRPPAKYTTAP